jgi:hypothetical protein
VAALEVCWGASQMGAGDAATGRKSHEGDQGGGELCQTVQSDAKSH